MEKNVCYKVDDVEFKVKPKIQLFDLNKILLAMKQRGVSKYKLGKALKYSNATIAYKFNGRIKFSVEDIVNIANYLRVDIKEFFVETQEYEP